MFSYSPAVVVLPPMLANAKLEDVILGWTKVPKTGMLLADAKGNNVRTDETINGVKCSKIRAQMLRIIRGRPVATIGLASFWIGPKDHFFDILKPQTHVSLVKCTQP